MTQSSPWPLVLCRMRHPGQLVSLSTVPFPRHCILSGMLPSDAPSITISCGTKMERPFFAEFDLGNIGMVLHAGHEGGPCPNANHNGPKIKTNIIIPQGIFRCEVRYCSCPQADGSVVLKDVQLLRIRLYPTTSQSPTTAFSFDCLEDFHLQAVECKTAALKYIMKLR